MKVSQNIDAKIRAERQTQFNALNLPAEFIAPNYNGRSIVNVSASIVKLFGGQIDTPALDNEITEKYSSDIKRIVYIIADALGYARLREVLTFNPHNGFHALLKNNGRLIPITSVFPSSTTAALSSIWCGYTPAEHGFVGYQMFLREQGLRAEMISFNPVATKELGGSQLVNAGLEPDKFLAVPSLPQTLTQVGVPVYNLIEQPYVKSALSRVQIRGIKETFGFVTSSDMWVTLKNVIEAHQDERALFVAYWSAVDSISHLYGPSSRQAAAEIDNLAFTFEREFLNQLSATAREGTLFMLIADHGQIDTPSQHAIYLRQHPELQNRLVMDFAGEPRAPYLYVRNGELGAVCDYIAAKLGSAFTIVDSKTALQAGLFGMGNFATETPYRIGDLILLPREDYYLWDKSDEPKLLGRHGALAEREMMVPLLIARLDG